MKGNLEYRTSVLKTDSGSRFGMEGLYNGPNLFQDYLHIGSSNGLEASYLKGMCDLEKYLNTILTYASNYLSPLAEPYSVELKTGRRSYELPSSTNERKLKNRCARCWSELDNIGLCKKWEGNLWGENAKERYLQG